MKYTDAEMLMASQIAYLNCSDDFKSGKGKNVGDLVDTILNKYGTYDKTTGTYIIKDGVNNAAKAQFETAQNILNLSEQNNVVSWRHWSVVDSNNLSSSSGYYGCLIDTGDGNAIVGCRGSESYDMDQTIKDWVIADVGRMNNPLTRQQADATKYMQYLYDRYGDKYDSFSFTGHSLGGSLAMHAAITAPAGMQAKTDNVISYDGPGFSNEYLQLHAEQINRIKDKLNHYGYSWVGELLNQPSGINDRIIKAHDDRESDNIFSAQLVRHHTRNIEFDENGNVMAGEKGYLQQVLGPLTGLFENSPAFIQLLTLNRFICSIIMSYVSSVGDQIRQRFEQVVQDIVEKVNELYNAYLLSVVSGTYEIHSGELSSMADSLNTVQRSVSRIASRINEIKRNLPYDSLTANYYKNCLMWFSWDLESEGRKAQKISKTVDAAVRKYTQGDQKVSDLFPIK